MDTRFWGPSGWKLLHIVTFAYNPNNKINMDNFLETLPYILPCKFCRASLTEYYEDHPYDKELNSQKSLAKWMYTIHNCVNDKLRKQHLNPMPDPKFTDVAEVYRQWLEKSWNEQLIAFWDFLFAVAYNHPKEVSKKSKPMPNCPDNIHKTGSTCQKNKWNVLDIDIRIKWFNRFWSYLPAILPDEIKIHWNNAIRNQPPTLDCRRSTVAWLWRLRCEMDKEFTDPYQAICKRVASYSSDCSANKRAKTCRRKTRKGGIIK